MRRPHFFMTTSRRSIGRACGVLTIERQVLCDTEYALGQADVKKSALAACDEAVGVRTRRDHRAVGRLTLNEPDGRFTVAVPAAAHFMDSPAGYAGC